MTYFKQSRQNYKAIQLVTHHLRNLKKKKKDLCCWCFHKHRFKIVVIFVRKPH